MKEGSLFVLFYLYLWDPPNRDASDRILGLFGKLLTRRGAWAWFHDVWTCDAKVLEYWMISLLKIKLDRSWKFRRNWNVPLVLLEKSWWAGFNGIFWVRFGFRMWEIFFLEVISAAENSNKFQKTRFWREKSVEYVITLGPMAQATLVHNKIVILLHWISTLELKLQSHLVLGTVVLSPLTPS